jgi:Cys-rich repeat protein
MKLTREQIVLIIVALLLVILILLCRRRRKCHERLVYEIPSDVVPPTPVPPPPECTVDGDCGSGAFCIAQQCVSGIRYVRVHFDDA